MFRFNKIGQFGLTAAALLVSFSPVQAAWISGTLSGTGNAGLVIGQNGTDFQNPVGPPNGGITIGVNSANATGSLAGLSGMSGAILDFVQSGSALGLANFMTVQNFTLTLDSVAPGSNYGGQNVWKFEDNFLGASGTLLATGRIFDNNNPSDAGIFQASFSTQFIGMNSAQLIGALNGGNPLTLQSYSFAVNSPVPEPGSWAMMIGGLGLVGIGLRRSRN